MALLSRLVITCCSRSGSTSTCTGPESSNSCTLAASAMGVMASMACLRQLLQVAIAIGEGRAARLHALQVENVVDQANQPVGVGDRDAQQVRRLLPHLAQQAGRQQSQRSANGGEGGAQFMAHGGDEFILHAVQSIALADIAEAEHAAHRHVVLHHRA